MTLAARLGTAALLLAAVVPVVAAPDVRHGEEVYVRCMACHALSFDRVGPRHCGLFGRLAGSVPERAKGLRQKTRGIGRRAGPGA